MRWEDWEPIYLKIVKEMNYSVEEDIRSAEILNEIISGRSLTLVELKDRIGGKDTSVVFGAGPSLSIDIKEFIDSGISDKVIIIVADGACRAFLERGLRIDILVTDLDGGDEELIDSSRRCLATVVHAHGDNIEKISSLVPRLHGRILGTTQCKPHGYLYNFGGFTDGDRAVFLSDALGFEKIFLGGMDFGEEIGLYSKKDLRDDPIWIEVKKRKLSIGKNLLELYSSRTSKKLYNATSNGEEIKGFKKVSFKEAINLI
ncbi:MAG: 6-hydroxymethylpterin diphosphokinase MptE-like protein [Candidatus Caldarchaeales archaeon]